MENRHILVVEDDGDDYEILCGHLRNAKNFNFEIAWAQNLSRAREYLATGSFDAVLLDYRLHEGRGTHIVDEILAGAGDPRLVLLSGNEDSYLDPHATQLLRRGAIRFVSKRSLTPEELVDVLTSGS